MPAPSRFKLSIFFVSFSGKGIRQALPEEIEKGYVLSNNSICILTSFPIVLSNNVLETGKREGKLVFVFVYSSICCSFWKEMKHLFPAQSLGGSCCKLTWNNVWNCDYLNYVSEEETFKENTFLKGKIFNKKGKDIRSRTNQNIFVTSKKGFCFFFASNIKWDRASAVPNKYICEIGQKREMFGFCILSFLEK